VFTLILTCKEEPESPKEEALSDSEAPPCKIQRSSSDDTKVWTFTTPYIKTKFHLNIKVKVSMHTNPTHVLLDLINDGTELMTFRNVCKFLETHVKPIVEQTVSSPYKAELEKVAALEKLEDHIALFQDEKQKNPAGSSAGQASWVAKRSDDFWQKYESSKNHLSCIINTPRLEHWECVTVVVTSPGI
jgi:hypothetical protein